MPKLTNGIDKLEGEYPPSHRINAKPRQGGNLPGHGLVSQEDTMHPDSIPDPRIRKAQAYLRRVQDYYHSPHVKLWDAWIDYSIGDATEVEITTRNLNICRAIRHAVSLLGGKVSLPRVERRVFMRDDVIERHKVLVLRFKFSSK